MSFFLRKYLLLVFEQPILGNAPILLPGPKPYCQLYQVNQILKKNFFVTELCQNPVTGQVFVLGGVLERQARVEPIVLSAQA